MNILLIAPPYFNYEKYILSALKERYKKVIFAYKMYIMEWVPLHNKLYKIFPSITQKMIENYNQLLIDIVLSEQIDRILIIRGDNLLPMFFEKIKCKRSSIEIIHYQWDSLSINPFGLMIRNYADRNYSFDIVDCDTYPEFSYLPLFYTWPDADKINLSPDAVTQDIDLLFLGSSHSNRVAIVSRVEQDMEKNGIRFLGYIYSSLKEILYSVFMFKSIMFKNVHIKKVSRKDYYRLLCRSKVVLDIPWSKQAGATIRTIEALSLGRKVVSTNTMLKREAFFSEKNIQIWDPNTPLDISKLLISEFDHSLDSEILSLSQWLLKMGI
jgi:hypothetical protein